MDEHQALTHLATILAAAFIGGAVFQRLKQPVLVGYIIVGIILGPSVLGVVSGREDIALFAELGILLLLFIAGMELDLNNFKSVAKVSIITCCAQIGIGLTTMFLLGYFLDWPINRSILLGFAVALSSTAVALKILDDTGLRPTRIGESSLGILIAQDIAVIPMILIIGALNTAEGFNYDGLIKMSVALGVMIGVVLLFTAKPAIFYRFWHKIEMFHDTAMQGQTAITGLAVCFTASAIAGFFGLSAAYGAFLAGLLVGNMVSHKQLEQHTKPIFDVMIMVFFLSIGLLIDLQFLQDHWLAVIALLLVTMVLKTIVNISVLRCQGMEKNEAYVTGAVLAQVGEFSFILAAMGLAAGTIQDDGYKYVVAIISLSLLITPLWLYLVKRYQILENIRFKKRKENIENSPM
jgi:CPA2 family monovalent cation:H+ antiporter-2